MKHEIEIEWKNMLTEEEFIRLQRAFAIRDDEWHVQQNYYFDTPNFSLKAQHSALRIRHKNGAYTLTLKQPYEDGLLETHESLSTDEAMRILNGEPIRTSIGDHLQTLGIDPQSLVCFGCLTTRRAERPYKGGTLVFDHSHYLEKDDYEVEYEARARTEGERIFHDLLASLAIPLRETENKIARFYRAKFEGGKNE